MSANERCPGSTGSGVDQETDVQGAVRELQKATQISGENPAYTATLARAYTGLDRKAEAVALLNSLKGSSVPDFAHAIHIAMIYTALGNKDEAIIWLNRAMKSDLILAF